MILAERAARIATEAVRSNDAALVAHLKRLRDGVAAAPRADRGPCSGCRAPARR